VSDRSEAGEDGPDPVIPCVECGGRAHLITPFTEDDPFVAGDLLTYRCADCLDRFDVLLDEPDA
jgi:hypothetical protein